MDVRVLTAVSSGTIERHGMIACLAGESGGFTLETEHDSSVTISQNFSKGLGSIERLSTIGIQ